MNIKDLNSIEYWQNIIELDIIKYNRFLTKENKLISKDNDKIILNEKLILAGYDDGFIPARPIYRPEKEVSSLVELLPAPEVIEVTTNADGLDTKITLADGSEIFYHRTMTVEAEEAQRVKRALAHTVFLTKIEEQQKQDIINRGKFNRDAEALVDQFGVCAEKLKSNVEQFFGQEGVKILCKVGANISEREKLNQPDQGN